MRHRRLVLTALAVAWLMAGAFVAAQAPDIRGSWHAETYLLKDGTRHTVQGLIFFTAKDWTVLFFVTPDGQAQRGSGEGGTYVLNGEALTFTHFYNLSVGKAVAGIPESPLQMTVNDATKAGTEACRVTFEGDRLTIHFPSGNRMMFRRSSGF